MYFKEMLNFRVNARMPTKSFNRNKESKFRIDNNHRSLTTKSPFSTKLRELPPNLISSLKLKQKPTTKLSIPIMTASKTTTSSRSNDLRTRSSIKQSSLSLTSLILYSICLCISNHGIYVSSNTDLATKPTDVLELTSDNYDSSTKQYQIVVLNFYAEWCPYSARWNPVFRETAKLIYNETSQTDPNVIVFGRVNCEVETTLSQRFRITKFPTTKLTLNGKALKKEYRGPRTAAAFEEYIKKFLADPITYVNTHSDIMSKVDESSAVIIMYSGRLDEHDKQIESKELKTFRNVAQQLREECKFLYALNSASGVKVTPPDLYTIEFKPHHKHMDSMIRYTGSLSDLTSLAAWAKSNCVPLVREITFGNAEELTEEGLPFVILFYDPKDKSWIEIFKRIVEQDLIEESNGVKFLFADGYVFSHPLKHLGKTTQDLPLVAIDSFKHLFIYKHPITTISQPGYLKQFIADLHSGKLDREFHFGPDPVSSQTSPPESAFNKLAPSAYRYSLLNQRDEL